MKPLLQVVLEEGFERKRSRWFILLFQKGTNDVNGHREDGG